MNLRRLHRDAEGAAAAIVARFTSHAKPFQEDEAAAAGYAWGEFLDEQSFAGQVGIFGTVAAIEVLVQSGYDPDGPLLEGARRSLAVHFPDPGARWCHKRDYEVTLKRAWLAGASSPTEAEVDATDEHIAWLVTHQLRQQGWGVYSGEGDDRSPESDFTSTCHALIALSRNPAYVRSESCRAATLWVVRYVSARPSTDVADLALARLAVRSLSVPDLVKPDEVTHFLEATLRLLEQYAKGRRRGDDAITYRTHSHTIGLGNGAVTVPFNIPRELIVAVALLQVGNHNGVRLIAPYVRSALAHKGLPTQERFRTETQLWALRAFRLLTPERLEEAMGRRGFLGSTTSKRGVVLVVALVIVLLELVLPPAANDASGATGLVRKLVTAGAWIGASVVAGMILLLGFLAARSSHDG